MTRIGHDADVRSPRQGRKYLAQIDQRQIAIEEAPRLLAAMSREGDQQRVVATHARHGSAKLGEKLAGAAIDQHSLHAEAAGRGCGGEIAGVDGRRTKPAGGAARHSGVQRDSTHPSTSMITTGQLLACGTFVCCRTGTVSGSGGAAGVSV